MFGIYVLFLYLIRYQIPVKQRVHYHFKIFSEEDIQGMISLA